MSSYTEIAIRPAEPPPALQDGQQALNLKPILGNGGRQMLERALEDTRDRRRRGEDLPGVLAWTVAEQADDSALGRRTEHRLRFAGDTLPESLRQAGADRLTVSLRLDGAIASIHHEVRSARQLPEAAQQLAEKTAHRAFNHLVAYALANKITDKVKERLGARVEERLQERARLVVAEREVYRTYANTGGPGGGTPWP